MDHNPDRFAIWPNYFDSKSSRRSGRRVGKDASVPKPDLDGLLWAARSVGLRKMKREDGTSHPSRPHAKEGRLWISCKAAATDIGTANKEEVMQIIGTKWRELVNERRAEEKESQKAGPKTGDKRALSQRKTTGAARQAAAKAAKSRKQRGRKKWKK